MPWPLVRFCALPLVSTVLTYVLLARAAAEQHSWVMERRTPASFAHDLGPVYLVLTVMLHLSLAGATGRLRRLIQLSWLVLFGWSVMLYSSPMCYSSGVFAGILPVAFGVVLVAAAWVLRAIRWLWVRAGCPEGLVIRIG